MLNLLKKTAIALLVIFLLLLTIAFAVMEPAYRNYHRVLNASIALAYGQKIASVVSSDFALTSRLPKSLGDLQSLPERPPEVKKIEFNPENGALHITVTDVPNGEDALDLVPNMTADGHLTYSCKLVSIPEESAPRACKD